MGREVRKVPHDWQHPQERGRFKPLCQPDEPIADMQRHWEEEAALWNEGKHPGQIYDPTLLGSPFSDLDGDRPDPADYMPFWPEIEATHFQMYETTSEGTPISPVMESPEKLARWLADTGACSWASYTATYDQWLRVCNGGFAPSAVETGGTLSSGVEALTEPSP